MVHVRFEGRSYDFNPNQINVASNMNDREIKRRIAQQMQIAADKLNHYVVDRTINGDLIIRPEAVYG